MKPTPIPPTPKRKFNVLLSVLAGTLLAIAAILAVMLMLLPPVKTAAPVVKTAPAKAKKAVVNGVAPAAEKAAVAPAPAAAAQPIQSVPAATINIYNCNNCSNPTVVPTQPAPVPQPAPAPSVQVPTPAPMPPPPLPPVFAPPTRQEPPVQAPFAPVPERRSVQSSGLTFQFNVFANGGWGGAYSGYGYYGSTYGWTPGHEEMRYDPRTGTYYRVWVSHPQPGY